MNDQIIEYKCKYCGKICKNDNSLRNHERLCKNNPNRQESSFVKHLEKIRSGERTAWNKGLTKDDERIQHNINSHKNNLQSGKTKLYWLGKHLSDEHKQKLSIAQTNYLVSNNLNRWSNAHSSKRSYPETYFSNILNAYCVEQYHIDNLPYIIDFANIKNKIAIEIDGEQHYIDNNLSDRDKKRDKILFEHGWKTIRIRWSTYQKLSINEKNNFVEKLLKSIE